MLQTVNSFRYWELSTMLQSYGICTDLILENITGQVGGEQKSINHFNSFSISFLIILEVFPWPKIGFCFLEGYQLLT